ncbi:seminal metalloprotease 1-like [Anopheles marshallii]|uniref:seminal metalloprotease 1-like n=1 Tax=Anopheles marshallii TaxID=1521116 RepID=UPI00237C0DE5|nr:seminal metalloprotease 1-like [Anopheles marshallii]
MVVLRGLCLAVFTVVLVQAGVIKNSPENAARLRNLRPDELAEELSGQFEGDIVLSEEQERSILSNKRNGLIASTYRWPGDTVPVLIVEEDFTTDQIEHIKRGLRQIELVTCLKFVTRTNEADYVQVIGTGSGCYSSVGHRGGAQTLNLEPYAVDTGCFRLATIVHEFIHALGFYHQQSASDRDQFVDIVWDNIEEGKQHNFNIYDADTVTDFNVMYDYGSVMHYSSTAFSKNGEKTIVPKDPNAAIGQRVGMSERDISKLNHMYKCLNKN